MLAAQVRSQASYRGSFALDLFSNAALPLLDLIAIFAMFRVTRTLGGFSATDVVTMFALVGAGFCAADLAVGNIEKLQQYVRQGLLDAVLVRPLGVLGQLICLDFTLRRIARLLLVTALLSVALWREHVAWNAGRVALVVLAPASAALFFGAVFVAGATVAFWWIESGEFANGFTYGGRDFASYPTNIYSGAFRRVFAFSLGFAFVGYYPALALLGRTDPLGLPTSLGWYAPLVGLAAAGLAALAWRFGIRHYRSTGS
jgi:ABC-2 type transport system permease protein